MNEQLILKLVDDAELDIVSNPDMPDYKWVEGTEEDLMKLIELVVRECAEVLYARSGHAQPADLYEHFGVEE